ncbi:unnamed protein product [Fraxinus pennsylvanica]|uniref:Uncharacterized protein n=1 Tax=Fraxinus pennsylvanica TaxID=56036 RepID=A0AAD2EB79_9LAMI|nr:unnamed protein product [Fraxinus pennsylvanica]
MERDNSRVDSTTTFGSHIICLRWWENFDVWGLAKSGPLQFRSSDVFTMDVSMDEQCWRCVTSSGMPGAENPGGIAPPARLDHVVVSLPGGRILVIGGFVASLHSASQLYTLDPTK